ncbi:MAG: hypothetical protein WCS89_00490 [Candidatus Paceibacterota bacterium]
MKTSSTNKTDAILARLKKQRARGRIEQINTDAHLIRLKEKGDITQAQFDDVTGRQKEKSD